MSPPGSSAACGSRCEGLYPDEGGMTDPGCRAFEVQPPVSVISVDGVRRALRDMNAEADIDPRAAQMVCDLLDSFTVDVASQAAGICRSRGGKMVTKDDLRFSLARLGIPAAVLDHSRGGGSRSDSLASSTFSLSTLSSPSSSVRPCCFPPFSLPRQSCSFQSSPSSPGSLRSLIQQSEQRQQRLLRQLLREQRQSASTPGARPEGGRKIRVRTVSHASSKPSAVDVSSVYSTRLSSLGVEEGSSRGGLQQGQSEVLEHAREGRDGGGGGSRERGAADEGRRGGGGGLDGEEQNDGASSRPKEKAQVVTAEANGGGSQDDEEGEKGRRNTAARGQGPSTVCERTRGSSESLPKGLVLEGGGRGGAEGGREKDGQGEKPSAEASDGARSSKQPVYTGGVSAERVFFSEESSSHVQQNTLSQTPYLPGARSLHQSSGAVSSVPGVPAGVGHGMAGLLPEIVVTSPVPPFSEQRGHSLAQGAHPALSMRNPQHLPAALPHPPSSEAAATLAHPSLALYSTSTKEEEDTFLRQRPTPHGISLPPYANSLAAQKHLYMTPHQETAERTAYPQGLHSDSASPIPGGRIRSTEALPGQFYPNSVPTISCQPAGYVVPVFFETQLRADRRNRGPPAGMSEVTPLKGSLPGGGRLTVGGPEDLK